MFDMRAIQSKHLYNWERLSFPVQTYAHLKIKDATFYNAFHSMLLYTPFSFKIGSIGSNRLNEIKLSGK